MTVIPKLIIFDVYGTLIKADEKDDKVRPGLIELLDFYKDCFKVTCSDGRKDIVEHDLIAAKLYESFDNHYFEDSLILYPRVLKNLGKICDECRLPVSDAVFIGDNFVGRDKNSATEFGIRFIKVPQFRSFLPDTPSRMVHGEYVTYDRDNTFSFRSLIGKL